MTNLILGLIFVTNVLLIISVFLLLTKLKKINSIIQKGPTVNRRINTKAAKCLEEKANEEFSKIVISYKKSLDAGLKKCFSDLADAASKQNRDLAVFCENQQKAITSETQYLVANNVVKVENEIENYRKDRIAAIDKQVTSAVNNLAKEILGKTIDLSTHEELVRE